MKSPTQGSFTVQVTAKHWIKVALFVAACVYTHARMECNKLDKLSLSFRDLNGRVVANQQQLADIKTDYHETTKELRSSIEELNTFLRDRQALVGPTKSTPQP